MAETTTLFALVKPPPNFEFPASTSANQLSGHVTVGSGAGSTTQDIFYTPTTGIVPMATPTAVMFSAQLSLSPGFSLIASTADISFWSGGVPLSATGVGLYNNAIEASQHSSAAVAVSQAALASSSADPASPSNPPASSGVTSIGSTMSSAVSSQVSTSSGPTSIFKSTLTTTPSSQATSSTATSTNRTLPPSGHSTAELAGVAVGCAVGGALIAGIIAFFLLRQRQRRTHRSDNSNEKELSPLHGHGEAIYLAGVNNKTWERHLPQAEPDSTIRAMTNRILDQIEGHVENFYTDVRSPSLGVDTMSAIEEIGSPHLPRPILDMLPAAEQPTLLLKHCVAFAIISRIDFSSKTNPSFLPKDFTNLNIGSEDKSKQGLAQAQAHWRLLTSYLRTNTDTDEHYKSERDRAITTAARELCYAFAPWAQVDESTRVQSMVGIMKRASELGIMLFSQSSSFSWQWQAPNRNRVVDQLVILPGLTKVTDSEAMSLPTILRLVEPRVGTLASHDVRGNAGAAF